MLRKEDDLNTCSDSLLPKDEELMNNVIPSLKIDNSNKDIFVQDIFNTFPNDLTIWDEPLEEGVDYSLPHERTLAKEDEIMIDNSLDSIPPSMNLNHFLSKGKASPSPQLSPTHKDTLVQGKMVNIFSKDLPLKGETLKSNVDLSPRESITHVDPLVIEDDMTFPKTSMPTPSLPPKIDLIYDNILMQEETINNSSNNLVHSSSKDTFDIPKPSSINLIHCE